MDFLVVIPESVTYFYELIGHRLRAALEGLGHTVALERLHTFAGNDYDCCFLVNLADIVQGYLRTLRGTLDQATQRVGLIRQRSGVCAHVLLEYVSSPWYEANMRWCRGLRIHHRVDMGYHRQPGNTTFLFNGLTAEEQRHVHDLSIRLDERRLPWAFIATASPLRADIARRLVESVDSRGFLYLRNPQGEAVGWTEPHLNHEQFLQVQRHARLSVWCSHHAGFYVESERFRMAAMAGAVPVKILTQPIPRGLEVPFRFLMPEVSALEEAITGLDYEENWYRFREELLRLPALEVSLAGVMEEIGGHG